MLPMSDVVVLLPGILGSTLRRGGRDVWGLSGGATLRALLSLGGSIKDLALADERPDDDPGDGVTVGPLLPDVTILPGLWKIDGYSKVSSFLRTRFDLRPGDNYFEFPYDWRRDNRIAARRLARESATWLARWRAKSGKADAKLILLAHSMGGLVSRHFLEVLDGWRDTRALLTFGTPFGGSLNALDSLANGMRKGPLDLTALVRSLTSVYQLLPTFPCYLPAAGAAPVHVDAADIPHVDRARATAALGFHAEIAEKVKARGGAADGKTDYLRWPIVGIQQATGQSATAAPGGVTIVQAWQGADNGGDGTVPRVSALPGEIASATAATMFASTPHASLQNADAVLVEIEGLLTGLSLDLGPFRPRGIAEAFGISLGLDVEDAYVQDEPLRVRVRSTPERVELRVRIDDVEQPGVRSEVATAATPEWTMLELPPQPPGTYRITVGGPGRVEPARDVFVVLPPG